VPDRLAIDERRGAFEPAVWHAHPQAGDQAVEQVWSSGGHCDVGAGYPDARPIGAHDPAGGSVAHSAVPRREDPGPGCAPEHLDAHLRGTLRTTRVPVDWPPARVRRTAS